MSTTLGAVRKKLRYHLNDLDLSRVQFSDPRLNMAISSARVLVAGATYMPHAWSNADFTTSTSTDTYALAGTPQIEQVLAVVNADSGVEIQLVSRAEFQAMRFGITDPSATGGEPQFGTLIESVANAISVQLHPWPDAAYRFNVLRAQLSADAVNDDSAALAFDAHGVEALAARAAELVAGKAAPEVLAALKLAPGCVEVFAQLAAEAESQSRIRRRRMLAVGHTRRVRGW